METGRLVIFFIVAAIVTILNFRVAAAWRSQWGVAARSLAAAVAAVAGVAVIVWGFVALEWYWALASIALAYLLAYVVVEVNSSTIRPHRSSPVSWMNVGVPVLLDSAVIACGVYMWTQEWPF